MGRMVALQKTAVSSLVVLLGLANLGIAGNLPSHKSMGPEPLKRANGYLQVYTATDEFLDGDNTVRYPHTDYFINRPEGSRYKFVANHITRSDEMPEVVELPPGEYVVVAEAGLGARVHVSVMVKATRTTVVDLESGYREKPSTGRVIVGSASKGG
jgi:hypothetical protein